MAEKDPRFQAVAWMINSRKKGGIKKFKEIFEYVPKTKVANEMCCHTTRMQRLIDNPLELTLAEIDKLADLFGCTSDKLIILIRRQKIPALNQKPGSIKNPESRAIKPVQI